MRTYVGSFVIDSTKAATETVSITGVGFTGQVLICAIGGKATTDADVGVGTTNVPHSLGFATASDERGCLTSWDDKPDAGTEAGNAVINNAVIAEMTNWDTYSGLIDFTSWDEDGFTLTYDVQWAANKVCMFMVIEGLIDAKVGFDTAKTTTGTEATTGVGFQPNCLFILGSTTVINANTVYRDMCCSFGMASSVSDQVVSYIGSEDGQDPTDCSSYKYQGEIFAGSLTGGGALTYTAELDSLDADGFTLDWTATAGNALTFLYLAMKGSYFAVSSYTTDGSAGDIAVTGLTGTPAGAILMSKGGGDNAKDTAGNGWNHNISFFDGTNQRLVHRMIADGIGEGDRSLYAYQKDESHRYTTTPAGAYTVSGSASWKSLDDGGFTVTEVAETADDKLYVMVMSGVLNLVSLAGEVTFAGTLTKQTNKGFAGAVTFAGAITATLYRMIQGFLRGMPDPTAYFRGYPNVDAAQEGYPDPTGDIEGGRKR